MNSRSISTGASNRRDSLASFAVDEPESDKCAEDPNDGRQERKGLVGPPATTETPVCDTAPVEGVCTAASSVVDVVDQDGKGSEPGEGQEQVDRPVEETTGEGEQPEQGEEHGKAGDDLNVDETSQRPATAGLVVVEIGSYDACDDLRTLSMRLF